MSTAKADKSGLISICRKAGKLKCGMDAVKSSCISGEAKAVFSAADLSEKSQKELRFTAAKYNIPAYRLSMNMQEIGYAMGKNTGVLAVTDKGFAKALSKDAEIISADIEEFYS